jgi:regulatory protein
LNHYPGILRAGCEISSAEEEALRFADVCFRVERVGMRLIARAEQTQAGLFRKLEARFNDSACVSAVMARFIENNLVNDERYAECWLRSRLSRKSGKIGGPRQLSAALGSRGIGREAIKGALDKALDEETEYTLLQRFLAKKPRGIMTGTYSLRGRLKHEGFSTPVINRYFDETAD